MIALLYSFGTSAFISKRWDAHSALTIFQKCINFQFCKYAIIYWMHFCNISGGPHTTKFSYNLHVIVLMVKINFIKHNQQFSGP